jgi:hypothetical protein
LIEKNSSSSAKLRRSDRIGPQDRLLLAQRLAGRQADHHELARPEAEARRAGDGEAEQTVGPMLHPQHGFGVLGGFFNGGGSLGGRHLYLVLGAY